MVEVLGNMKQGGKYSEFWPGLKNVQNVITLDFSDGNTFWDILKVVSAEYGKDFHFPKQYAPLHLYHDITHKGSTINYTTRIGEGFQQESQAAYFQTNYKNVGKQIVTIDANKEVLAYIAMDVETYDNELKELKALYDDNHEENNTSKELTVPIDNNHWRLGAPQHCLMTSKLSTIFPDNPILHTLTEDISNVVRQYLGPNESFQQDTRLFPTNVSIFTTQSLEDWKAEKDIACCNPSFHGHP
ncbi:hypothetical protein BU17DRAFT_72469 [Hysterangium stoloniferum]|nr:hypothetical protein BU17DRAFT_72469 [Hysterangium stoloniferum]